MTRATRTTVITALTSRRWRDRRPLRWLGELRLTSPPVWVTLAVLLVAGVAFLVTPETDSGTLDVQPNTVARRDYLATRSFTHRIPDPAAEARAREAEARVPRVYRHDPAIREQQVQVLAEVGKELRRLCVEQRTALESFQKEREAVLGSLQAEVDAAEEEQDALPIEAQLDTARTQFRTRDAELRATHEDAIARGRDEAMQRLGADVLPSSVDVLLEACIPEESWSRRRPRCWPGSSRNASSTRRPSCSRRSSAASMSSSRTARRRGSPTWTAS